MTRIGTSDLDVFPLALGGNVFGWTANELTSFAILDEFVARGGNFIDTADGYSHWVEGHHGGESETIIGAWLKERRLTNGPSGSIVVATKVSTHPQFLGLSAENVRAAAAASLERLGVSTIDLYYAHFDDPKTPLKETVEAFESLRERGIIRAVGVSNYTAERIEEWLSIADTIGAARPVAIQPEYNLVHRADVEAKGVGALAEREGLSLIPYYALASGFLTGKYRTVGATSDSPRSEGASRFATPEGIALIDLLDRIAAAHETSIAAVSLAWLSAQPNVAAPIASASKPSQVTSLIDGATIRLTPGEIDELDRMSAYSAELSFA